MYYRGRKQRRCICNTASLVKKITGQPKPLPFSEINNIRLNLFTERNSDGSGFLVLRGKDIYDRYERRINDLDIRAICIYVRELKRRITKIDLSYNQITDGGFFKLLKKLLVKGRSSVINLNIMNNELTEKSILNLAKYAPLIKLKYLRLNGNDIGTRGGEYFAQFLLNNTSLEFCDLGETGQTLSSVAQIITALRNDHGANESVRVFDFSRILPLFNRYSYETKWMAYHIEYLLSRNSTIIELNLQKNEFVSHDVEYLVRGLKLNKTLLYLDLGYNKIGDYGIELIAKYLRESPQLTLLNVAGNSIGDTGARALSYGMPYSKLRALDISHNKLTDSGVLNILNSIKKPYFLRFLNIWGNTFGHVTCGVIDRMLESGTLFQHTIDVKIYEVDKVLFAAYYPNPADRNKHLYYCELDYGIAQPLYHIKRNIIEEKKTVKVDCKQRHKLDKTDRNQF
ncbi:leucine-rich repeat-containing protein 34 [Manduca sexta]|uniref:leucine-rich repeat-containing protein 34 n=1 Tax=Manduca sexta TaxID=7130 RepID=UPI00188F3632|nr:leucine-rich repeat-containing protein 34 [Manduca sexta]